LFFSQQPLGILFFDFTDLFAEMFYTCQVKCDSAKTAKLYTFNVTTYRLSRLPKKSVIDQNFTSLCTLNLTALVSTEEK